MHGLQLQTLTGTWLQGRNRSVCEEQMSVHRERQSFRVQTSVFELVAQSSVYGHSRVRTALKFLQLTLLLQHEREIFSRKTGYRDKLKSHM
jgi:hypothetical protein